MIKKDSRMQSSWSVRDWRGVRKNMTFAWKGLDPMMLSLPQLLLPLLREEHQLPLPRERQRRRREHQRQQRPPRDRQRRRRGYQRQRPPPRLPLRRVRWRCACERHRRGAMNYILPTLQVVVLPPSEENNLVMHLRT